MPREAIRDQHNRLLGYLNVDGETIRVTDGHGRILGYVNEHGTYDSHHHLISRERQAGLLLHED